MACFLKFSAVDLLTEESGILGPFTLSLDTRDNIEDNWVTAGDDRVAKSCLVIGVLEAIGDVVQRLVDGDVRKVWEEGLLNKN